MLSDEAREVLAAGEDDRAFLDRPEITGGPSIVGPDESVLAGPIGHEEEVRAAELDLERCLEERLAHDFAGHYNRDDAFTLHVDRSPRSLYVEHGDPEAGASGPADETEA